MVRDLEIFPSVLQLGCRDIGSLVTEIVTVRSRSGRPIVVESVTSEDNTIEVEAAGNGEYRIRNRVERPGEFEKTLRFVIRSNDMSSTTLVLPIRSYGMAKE